eukprot:m.235227 g.235227  ORF g.235227 m.235227 type:complete len:83 (+) comp15259_c0_seq10:3663-3911(+)
MQWLVALVLLCVVTLPCTAQSALLLLDPPSVNASVTIDPDAFTVALASAAQLQGFAQVSSILVTLPLFADLDHEGLSAVTVR